MNKILTTLVMLSMSGMVCAGEVISDLKTVSPDGSAAKYFRCDNIGNLEGAPLSGFVLEVDLKTGRAAVYDGEMWTTVSLARGYTLDTPFLVFTGKDINEIPVRIEFNQSTLSGRVIDTFDWGASILKTVGCKPVKELTNWNKNEGGTPAQ